MIASKRRLFSRSLVGAAAALCLLGSAAAQETLKIGLLANLEGPFAVPGQDGYRGADMALKEKNGMAGGKKIEFVKVSSDATPDKAVAALSKFGGTVIKSSLSKETESELQTALHGSEKPAPVAV